MSRFERADILKKFRAMAARGEPIVGGGAGTGLSAKCEEAGGIDLIVIYNSGRYRMAGRGSLAGMMPYGDANAIVVEMLEFVRPIRLQMEHTDVADVLHQDHRTENEDEHHPRHQGARLSRLVPSPPHPPPHPPPSL